MSISMLSRYRSHPRSIHSTTWTFNHRWPLQTKYRGAFSRLLTMFGVSPMVWRKQWHEEICVGTPFYDCLLRCEQVGGWHNILTDFLNMAAMTTFIYSPHAIPSADMYNGRATIELFHRMEFYFSPQQSRLSSTVTWISAHRWHG